ncbi:imelysin family protein [Thermostichus vulcanus]|uniref:Peptidase M75 n=1 Tax=Thermostichus vulcanus str. 'Rupite' TaxID=2813851 RepID=A0ABT0CFK5_THEVL|nr:imelysin family protein [Thermostichus vulcanus]MCJ2544529.1 peptidase M75 [Thermostichus vulcanus str. 'Rupite']
MSAHLKLWRGIGLCLLVNGAGVAQAERDAQVVGTPPVGTLIVGEVLGQEAPRLLAQSSSGRASVAEQSCQPIAVEGGGEGGEGGEESGPSIPVITLKPEQHFQEPQIILDFVDQVVLPNYEQLVAETQDLSTAVQAFVEAPDEVKLEAARQAWFTARITWEESEAYAFGPAASLGLDADLDEWPLNEVDVLDVLESGDPLTSETVADLESGQKGFHAIAFLLFGVDNDKSLTDFTERDLEYLAAVAPVLANTAEELLQSWTEGVQGFPPFREEFVTAGEGSNSYLTLQAAAEEIAQGILGLLDELGNIKIGAAFAEQNPFLLESRFAHHSLPEFEANLRSVQYAYSGGFRERQGRGLSGSPDILVSIV